jgi:hypothetical protein
MSVSGDGASNPVVFRRDAVRVLVPATSANLGPAFDSAGLALELVDELVAMVTDDPGVLVEVSGEGSDDLPRDSSHLVVRAMALGFSALGAAPEGFVLRCTNVIPHGRGLGSSAAAIIGGLMLARALVVEGPHQLSDDDLLQLALLVQHLRVVASFAALRARAREREGSKGERMGPDRGFRTEAPFAFDYGSRSSPSLARRVLYIDRAVIEEATNISER